MGDDIGDAPAPEGADPATIRFLRRLVTLLTVTMIGGVLAVVALLVIRLSQPLPAGLPELPASIALPDGAAAAGVAFGRGWIAVVTDDERILVYDRETGELRQTVVLER